MSSKGPRRGGVLAAYFESMAIAQAGARGRFMNIATRSEPAASSALPQQETPPTASFAKPKLRVLLESAIKEETPPPRLSDMRARFTSFNVDDFSSLIMDAVMRDRGDILRIIGHVKGCGKYVDQYYGAEGDKFTPLQIAVRFGKENAAQALLEMGADPSKLTGIKNLSLQQLTP